MCKNEESELKMDMRSVGAMLHSLPEEEKEQLEGVSYYGAALYYLQKRENERLKPKKTEPPEPVPSKEEVLEQVDHAILMLKDALDVETNLHRRELMLDDVVTRLKTLQKGLHALLEEGSHEK